MFGEWQPETSNTCQPCWCARLYESIAGMRLVLRGDGRNPVRLERNRQAFPDMGEGYAAAVLRN